MHVEILAPMRANPEITFLTTPACFLTDAIANLRKIIGVIVKGRCFRREPRFADVERVRIDRKELRWRERLHNFPSRRSILLEAETIERERGEAILAHWQTLTLASPLGPSDHVQSELASGLTSDDIAIEAATSSHFL